MLKDSWYERCTLTLPPQQQTMVQVWYSFFSWEIWQCCYEMHFPFKYNAISCKSPLLLFACMCHYEQGKLEEAQREVEEVKGIMVDTLNKAEDRKEKLEDLDQRAAVLLNKVSMLSFICSVTCFLIKRLTECKHLFLIQVSFICRTKYIISNI